MIFEAECAAGLLAIATQEVRECLGHNGRIIGSHRNDSVQFTYDGDLHHLAELKTVISVYLVLQYDIPRPKALLGHENFQKLVSTTRSVCNLEQYDSLYISAAGSDSSVMQRVKSELATSFNLDIATGEGDLLLRIRRTPKTKQGWDVLIRLTPRPLSTRDWRVCNYEGALNASIAAAMVRLSNPTRFDCFLNIGCGSGTIIIERMLSGEVGLLAGIDIQRKALDCAEQNIDEAQVPANSLAHSDAIQMPFAPETFDKLVADLPFGQLTGSHDENEWLYPAILSEAARVSTDKARFVIITHEIKLMESVIEQSSFWRLCEEPLKINQSGLHPRIYVLERL